MRDYSKLTKKQLVALLNLVEQNLDGCIEEAERSAESKPTVSDHTKHAYMMGWVTSTIDRTLDSLAKAM